jgi:nucleoside-diphosphate-sugar epimerase
MEAVIHLAGRAHIISDHGSNVLSAYRCANVATTCAIVRAAIEASVGRFVFVSSIGVLGRDSGPEPFCETTQPAPVEPYAVSKLEAEAAITRLCAGTKTTLTIVRPPLVYGPGVRGNFLRLLRLVDAGWPLPFAGVTNLRSFMGVTNLAHLLMLCTCDSAAANQVFLASDGEDITLPDLLARLGRLLERRQKLFAAPAVLLRAAARAMGHGVEVEKLLGSLQVDATKSRIVLGWTPVKDLDTGLAEMTRWFMEESRTYEH